MLFYITLFATCSILLSGLFCDLIGCQIAILISAILLVFLLVLKIRFQRNQKNFLLFVLIVFVISTISYSSNRHLIETKFQNSFGKTQVFEAEILTYPKINGDINTYEVASEGGKLKLSVWKPDTQYKPGDVIKIKAAIKAPEPARNPGGFDNQNYLLTKGIGGEIFAGKEDVSLIRQNGSNFLFELGYQIKMSIVNSIKNYLPPDRAALLNSMLIGYTEDVDPETKQDFNDAGLTHLMAVSGMNVTFVLLPVIWIAKKLKARRKLVGYIGLGSLLVFMLITGFAPSIVRASVMAGMVLLSRMIDKDCDFATSIALSALVMEIVNPLCVFDLGFQFSFCATIGIVLMSNKISLFFETHRIPKGVAEVLGVTIAAQLSVLPIMVNYFNQVSIISVLSNLIVVPLTGVITVLGFLLSGVSTVPIFANPIAFVVTILVGFVKLVSQYAADIPGATLKIPDFGVFGTMIYFIALYGVFNFKKTIDLLRKSKQVSFVVVVVFLVAMLNFLPDGKLKITVFDVGQGDSILISTPKGQHVLVDTGDGKTKLSSVLLGMGISNLDLVILTHSHSDHVGGLAELQKWIPIKSILREDVQAGNFISLEDGLKIDFLNPQTTALSEDDSLANEQSIVSEITYKKFNILLTADTGFETENTYISNRVFENVEILKVGHHGSNYSSGENFLSYNAFQNGIISVGKNLYGHPSAETIKRLKTSGCQVFRTDYDGAINIATDGNEYTISCNLDISACGRLIDEFGKPKKTYRAR